MREDRRVILLMAGLPYHVSNLLSGKSTSFIRRAARHDLGSIPAYEAREAFRLTTEQGGAGASIKRAQLCPPAKMPRLTGPFLGTITYQSIRPYTCASFGGAL